MTSQTNPTARTQAGMKELQRLNRALRLTPYGKYRKPEEPLAQNSFKASWDKVVHKENVSQPNGTQMIFQTVQSENTWYEASHAL